MRAVNRAKPASMTAKEQARIDALSQVHDRVARNRKIMHLYKTLSYTEVAERLGLPVSTVEGVVRRAGPRKRRRQLAAAKN